MSNLSDLLPTGGGQNAVDFVASGTLSSGQTVVLNSDGTVSFAGLSTTPQSIPESNTAYSAGLVEVPAIAFDPSNPSKFVIAYKNGSAGNAGYAVIGTVSGSTISFGSEYQYLSTNNDYIGVSYSANKIAIVFTDANTGQYGTAIIGSVSGSAISFGSKVVFNSNSSTFNLVAFDPNDANKIVVNYSDSSNYGRVKVGTISGTSVSFGSDSYYNLATTYAGSLSFIPGVANNIFITYHDNGSGGYGTAIVGVVSGNSVSFGSEYVFNTAITYQMSASFNPGVAGQFVVAFRDQGNSGYGTAIVGSVSGTTITYGPEYVYNSALSTINSVAFYSGAPSKFTVVYGDSANSSYTTASVGTISGTAISFGTKALIASFDTTYITSASVLSATGKFVAVSKNIAYINQIEVSTSNVANFIGITAEAIANGATGPVNVYGGINEAQSGLTIGSNYYAQSDGSISTTVSDVLIGQAISTTTINIRDLT